MNNRKALLAVAAAMLLILVGCGSASDIFGTNQNKTNDIRGTVSSIDRGAGTPSFDRLRIASIRSCAVVGASERGPTSIS